MPDNTPPAVTGTDLARSDRLDSWKEIAAYLKRDVTTVRRWEKREGLPVHRHLHERRDSVYAYAAEIDEWESRRNSLTEPAPLGEVSSGNGDGIATVTAPATRRSRRVPPAWALTVTFFVTTVGLAALLFVRQAANQGAAGPELRFAIFPPDETTFGSVSLSPDGRQLAFTARPIPNAGDAPRLWVRPLDSVTARALPDTEDAAFPFWSPDGGSVGFFAGGKLWTINLAGGSPGVVADAPEGRGGTWNRDGTIVFAPSREGPLFRVAATGGEATAVTSVERPPEFGHLWPEFLPDGRHFLYLSDSDNAPEQHQVSVGSLDGDPPIRLASLASSVAVGPNNHLFFVRDRQLMAQPFDLVRLALRETPIIVVDKVNEQLGFSHKADFSVSGSGVLVYRTMQSPASRLVWRHRAQAASTWLGTPAEYYDPTVSPDDTRVAIGVFNPQLSKRFGYGVVGIRSDVWIFDRVTGDGTPFTTDPGADWGPVWSPDGQRIVFSSNRSGTLELYEKTAVGEGFEETLIPSSGRNPVAQSWSPDGRFLLYTAFDPLTHFDLWLLPMAGDRTPVPLLQTEFSEEQGQISPDGRWFAYSSNESGREEVYVRRFPEGGARLKISSAGGGDPRWRRDGAELYYIAADRRLMAVGVTGTATISATAPVSLFDAGVAPHWYHARNVYDVSRDGSFLLMAPIEDDRSSPFTMVINWAGRVAQPRAH